MFWVEEVNNNSQISPHEWGGHHFIIVPSAIKDNKGYYI